jgi:hypothetical protein
MCPEHIGVMNIKGVLKTEHDTKGVLHKNASCIKRCPEHHGILVSEHKRCPEGILDIMGIKIGVLNT